jgi:hypothetical protein
LNFWRVGRRGLVELWPLRWYNIDGRQCRSTRVNCSSRKKRRKSDGRFSGELVKGDGGRSGWWDIVTRARGISGALSGLMMVAVVVGESGSRQVKSD